MTDFVKISTNVKQNINLCQASCELLFKILIKIIIKNPNSKLLITRLSAVDGTKSGLPIVKIIKKNLKIFQKKG